MNLVCISYRKDKTGQIHPKWHTLPATDTKLRSTLVGLTALNRELYFKKIPRLHDEAGLTSACRASCVIWTGRYYTIQTTSWSYFRSLRMPPTGVTCSILTDILFTRQMSSLWRHAVTSPTGAHHHCRLMDAPYRANAKSLHT